VGTILLIVLILLLLGAIPVYPYSRDWGYRPASIVTVIVVIVILLVLFNQIPVGF
jgi:hypothetical protein